jgi:hypothetical protein
MALKTKAALELLTAEEQAHLTEEGVHNLGDFTQKRKEQIDLERRTPLVACFECRAIANKLKTK